MYLLKTKRLVLSTFKEFHALVEHGTGKKLKCLKKDSGGEYHGSFEDYFKMYDIRMMKTLPKSH